MLTSADAQTHLDVLHELRDGLLRRERAAIAAKLKIGGSGAELWERDAQIAHLEDSVSRLTDANDGLLFGHLDGEDGSSWYIGRMGMTDPETHDSELVDWRAPVARPFYTATPLHPDGVRVRSHIETNDWRVTRCSNEALGNAASDGAGGSVPPTSLLAAIDRSRTGHMGDIVATIQAEQDRIIRDDLRGTLLVQGGPGTGKTAVALHRAAFLLYEHRDRLERSGVLVVGPNATFLEYISKVLPSLGETSVVLSTMASLLPDAVATETDEPATAELKGRLIMAELVAAAVSRLQLPGGGDRAITLETGETLTLPGQELAKLRRRVRQRRVPHNEARPFFEQQLVRLIAGELLRQRRALGIAERMVDGDAEEIAEDLREDGAVLAAADAMWPLRTPEALLRAAYAQPAIAGGPPLSPAERALLVAAAARPGLTEADVPLLDEAAELLGEDPRPAAQRQAAQRERERAEIEYAQGVLDLYGEQSGDDDDPGLAIRAEELAARQRGRDGRTLAERAAADRTWTYGHIIVDEAQELTPMAVRSLVRRCPMQSMTFVGDINQAGGASAGNRWDDVIAGQLRSLRRAELTVNYRTPGEIMRLAGGVLAEIDPESPAPNSLRDSGREPEIRRVPAAERAAAAADRVAEFLAAGTGTVGIVAAPARMAAVRAALDAHPGVGSGASGHPEARVWPVTPAGSKGLEFDLVIVDEPALIADGSRAGLTNLYVALSRATQDLLVLHSEELPAGLRG